MGGENDKEGTEQHGADVASNDAINISKSPKGKKRMHRELEVFSNSNDDDDVKIIPKAAKVKREIIPSRYRRPPFTNDGRNQKKPRKKVESKESVIRNNMKTQITDWQNKEDINDLFCFLDQSKIHGEFYNDNGMSLVNCEDLSRLLDPSGWLGDEVINKTLYLLRKSKYFTGANHTWTYFDTYMLKILENKNDKVMERIRLGISPKHDDARPLPWDAVSTVYGVLNVKKTHWVALTIKMAERRITIYDSKIPPRTGKNTNIYEEIEILREYLRGVMGSGEWHCIFYSKNLPQQTDGSSCGVFAIKFIEHMIRDISFQKIEQSKTPQFAV
ncbi:sentrin-specific protease 1-like isoform X4 [Papaver somniferum]|uniref:sentrin-specific protease 1-like isoform X4 n=1 Tax=Papaver somniferum TaxID=3469 RepID=UPI000E7000D3|nr:sentrin-specific protease 1-like isoform X4 [Papaver somniferum]XP_026407327.1 sentrin-specific protease 1-like isoform X4 [Papaver somniferum]XP_026407329.1 sentrin-specific protease 1-like isoform X4 [Papaver somniferum]